MIAEALPGFCWLDWLQANPTQANVTTRAPLHIFRSMARVSFPYTVAIPGTHRGRSAKNLGRARGNHSRGYLVLSYRLG
jgi:hypothetical protein